MKCNGENVILRGIFHVISGFPLHFMLYRGNFYCFSKNVGLICTGNTSLLNMHGVQCTECTLYLTKNNTVRKESKVWQGFRVTKRISS